MKLQKSIIAIIATFVFALTAAAQVQYRNALDFDGDNKADYAVSRYGAFSIAPSSLVYHYVLNSSNGSSSGYQFGNYNHNLGIETMDIPIAGDFDGDHHADIAVVRPQINGNPRLLVWYIFNGTNNVRTIAFGAAERDRVLPADYDGDGITDIAVARYSDSGTYFDYYWIRSRDGQIDSRRLNHSYTYAKPRQLDYDGDGKADPSAMAYSGSGQIVWVILQSSNNQTKQVAWGINGDREQVGDFDGDGKSDLTVVRKMPDNSYIWYILQSSNNQLRSVYWGGYPEFQQQHIPAAADYDGDGKTDITTYAPSQGTFYTLKSSTNQPSTVQWGRTTGLDLPMQITNFQALEGEFLFLQLAPDNHY